ncbi:hypothetical protein ABZV92_35835 [Streptomyces rubiginosohelvolus]|uniref:hypothetical protein n=1 Tax=Streptomyces rubiginosohelvolus TaxID=67362 RepID=UPI0033BB95C7
MSTPKQPDIDLTLRREPLSLADIGRALGLSSRGTAHRWHKPPGQSAMDGKPPATKPALHAVAEALGTPLDPALAASTRPRFPVDVVLALGKALGYLDADGRIVEALRSKGRGRWLPAAPTIDPATGKRRVYTNHLAAALGVGNETIERGLTRGWLIKPDGTDEIDRNFWWAPTANTVIIEYAQQRDEKPDTTKFF